MALSLSQKLDKSFTLPRRLLAAYGITDEIFAVCSTKQGLLKPQYMYGIIAVSTLGWTAGTFAGAAAGEILPSQITAALGIVLYGMFLAIIIPPAKKEKGILAVILIAAALSFIAKYLLPDMPGGFVMIICALIAAVTCALIFPKEDDEQ